MLTALYPEVFSLVQAIPAGLLPICLENDSRPKLVVKAHKEAILAAKISRGFKIYAAPIFAQSQNTAGLITAFFDDEDEPIVIFTTMFEEPGTRTLRDVILCGRIDVYFFDENNRELLGYAASLEIQPNTRSFIENAELLPFNCSTAIQFIDQMSAWFGLRSAQDDLSAISVTFGDALVPEDVGIIDAIPHNNSYHGSGPINYSQLIREEPGPFQERDIIQLLQRIFSPEQIYLDPLRVTDNEEITDVLVATDLNVLFIQAKDSPNVETAVRRTMIRKKTSTRKSLRKAVDQMRGTMRYARSNSPMMVLSGGKKTGIMLEGRQMRTLIIVKELFNDEYSVYSQMILPLAEEIQAPCIALDYSELHMYTSNLADEDSFFAALDIIFMHGVESGVFPRLRLWPDLDLPAGVRPRDIIHFI